MCPNEIIQNARVRRASDAVKWMSLRPSARTVRAAATTLAPPSICWPKSSGRPSRYFASHQAAAAPPTPATDAVVRHPNSENDHTMSGTHIPPIPRPMPPTDSARARRRSNQRTIETVTVTKPQKLEPTAISRNAT